jgi:hypothetical protein
VAGLSGRELGRKAIGRAGSEKFNWTNFANRIVTIDPTAYPQDFQDAFAVLVKSAAAVTTHENALPTYNPKKRRIATVPVLGVRWGN